jgi:hypothetical protein
MQGRDKFQVFGGETIPWGILLTSGSDVYMGQFMDRDPDNDGYMKLATNSAIGFLTQDVTEAGPTFEQLTRRIPTMPETMGNAVTLLDVAIGGILEIEEETGVTATTDGEHRLVTSGTGAISASTAINTLLGIVAGKLRVAQTNDFMYYRMYKSDVTAYTDGNIRVRVQRIAACLKS